jgi:hypothetical protein
MKTSFFVLLFLIASCDSPQRGRMPVNYVNSGSLNDPYFPGTTTGTTNGGTTTGTSTGGTTGSNTGSNGFENCDITPKYQTADIGLFGVCQNKLDETFFKFNPTLTLTSVRVCMIPTYKDQSGNSTYIGQPQCTFTTQGSVIQGRLVKDRQGYQNHPLNGMIVMRENLLPEYFGCMQAYTSWPLNACPQGAANSYCAYWLPQCGSYGAKTSANCDSGARAYMNSLCSQFKSKYSSAYVDITLK